jgi:hypothetical protein
LKQRDEIRIGGNARNFERAIETAQRFELADELALACENLSSSGPSSLAATFPLCRMGDPITDFDYALVIC